MTGLRLPAGRVSNGAGLPVLLLPHLPRLLDLLASAAHPLTATRNAVALCPNYGCKDAVPETAALELGR